MEKQKICIIGDGLSGLTSAIAINNLDNVEVHLISKKLKKATDKRTTAKKFDPIAKKHVLFKESKLPSPKKLQYK